MAIPTNRESLVQILRTIIEEHRTLEQAIELSSPEQRNWNYEIIRGTLTWMGLYERWLKEFSEQKSPKGWLRYLLLSSIYQICHFESVPMEKVVNETILVIKKKKGVKVAGFANALLRKICQKIKEDRIRSPDEILSTLPDWLDRALSQNRENQWKIDFAQSSLKRARIFIQLRPGKKLKEKARFEKTEVAHCFELIDGTPKDSIDIKEGRAYVQNISNQILLNNVCDYLKRQNLGSGTRILDLCSAPGGKAIGMAWKGYFVVATEYQSKRFDVLEKNRKIFAPDIELIKWADIEKQEKFEVVWVDAPCSGSGTLRRHPEIRWIKDEQSLESLISIQKKLIHKGLGLLKSDGILIYSVCSVLEQESFSLYGNWAQKWKILPTQLGGGDGFFAGAIKKHESDLF